MYSILFGDCHMSEEVKKDEIEERYNLTSNIRKRALKMLADDDEALRLSLADKESQKALLKLLDGEDKQTIARQKNITDEKAVGAMTTSLPQMVDEVIKAMGGANAIRGNPDPSAAPKEKIDIDVNVGNGELEQGEDTTLSYETLAKQNG